MSGPTHKERIRTFAGVPHPGAVRPSDLTSISSAKHSSFLKFERSKQPYQFHELEIPTHAGIPSQVTIYSGRRDPRNEGKAKCCCCSRRRRHSPANGQKHSRKSDKDSDLLSLLKRKLRKKACCCCCKKKRHDSDRSDQNAHRNSNAVKVIKPGSAEWSSGSRPPSMGSKESMTYASEVGSKAGPRAQAPNRKQTLPSPRDTGSPPRKPSHSKEPVLHLLRALPRSNDSVHQSQEKIPMLKRADPLHRATTVSFQEASPFPDANKRKRYCSCLRLSRKKSMKIESETSSKCKKIRSPVITMDGKTEIVAGKPPGLFIMRPLPKKISLERVSEPSLTKLRKNARKHKRSSHKCWTHARRLCSLSVVAKRLRTQAQSMESWSGLRSKDPFSMSPLQEDVEDLTDDEHVHDALNKYARRHLSVIDEYLSNVVSLSVMPAEVLPVMKTRHYSRGWNVVDQGGSIIFYVGEWSSLMLDYVCSGCRPFCIEMYDIVGNIHFALVQACSYSLCLCRSECAGGKCNIIRDDQLIGTVEQNCHLGVPQLVCRDSEGCAVLLVKGHVFGVWIAIKRWPFKVFSYKTEKHPKEVLVALVDEYGMHIQARIPNALKILLIAAYFLLEFHYYESCRGWMKFNFVILVFLLVIVCLNIIHYSHVHGGKNHGDSHGHHYHGHDDEAHDD